MVPPEILKRKVNNIYLLILCFSKFKFSIFEESVTLKMNNSIRDLTFLGPKLDAFTKMIM
jgi:hypothetical protein